MYFMLFEKWNKELLDSILWFKIGRHKIWQLVNISWYKKEEWFRSIIKEDFQKWIEWIFKDEAIERKEEILVDETTYY